MKVGNNRASVHYVVLEVGNSGADVFDARFFFFFLIQMSIPLTTYMSTGAAGFSNTQLNYTEQHATDVGVRQGKGDTVTDH